MPDLTPRASDLSPERTQLLMGSFTPSVAIGVNLVNMSTDALYNASKQIGFELDTIIPILIFSLLFGAIVFLLDKVGPLLKVIFCLFNVLTILHFCVATNNSAKLQASTGCAGWICSKNPAAKG